LGRGRIAVSGIVTGFEHRKNKPGPEISGPGFIYLAIVEFSDLLESVSSSTTEATTATSSSATTTATARSLNARPCLVDVDGFAFNILAVHSCDSRCRFFFRGHFHKSKTSGFAAEFVRYDVGGCDLAKRLKSLPQIITGRVIGQIAYINVHYNILSKKIVTPDTRCLIGFLK
jgi:hypothetical protein